MASSSPYRQRSFIATTRLSERAASPCVRQWQEGVRGWPSITAWLVQVCVSPGHWTGDRAVLSVTAEGGIVALATLGRFT